MVFSLSFLISCAGSKKLVQKELVPITNDDVLAALEKHNFDFNWLSAKANTELESPDERVSGSMIFRLKKDSAVWVVVKKLGIEFARVLVTPADYTVLYRMEGVYEKSSIQNIKKIVGVDLNFEDLQQWLFGNIILPDSQSVNIALVPPHYIVKSQQPDFLVTYYLNGYSLLVDKIQMEDIRKRVITAEYNEYTKLNNGKLTPYERLLTFPYSETENASIKLKFSEFEVDIPKELKFDIPSHYREI